MEEIIYRTTPQGDLRLVIHRPSNERGNLLPSLVHFHGGGWNGGSPLSLDWLGQRMTALGWIAVFPQYRIRSQHGTSPRESTDDAGAAVRYVCDHAAKLGVDASRLVIGGGSAGGHLALSTLLLPVARQAFEPVGVVLLNPVVDTTEAGFGHERFGADAREYSPIHHLRPGLPSTWIAHGTDDETVPYENVVRFQRESAALGNAVELVTAEGGRHGFYVKPTLNLEIVDALIAFISSLSLDRA